MTRYLTIAVVGMIVASSQGTVSAEPTDGTEIRPATGDPLQTRECRSDCPILVKEIVVKAPLDRVWDAWTSNEGLRFVSTESNVELRVGGPYEWFLDGPADDRGLRGSEGSRILAFIPRQMVAFAWTFPPETPSLREAAATTTVVVLFDEIDASTVQVKLQALGWQSGEEWRRGWLYFDAAWGHVLATLKRELETPPSH